MNRSSSSSRESPTRQCGQKLNGASSPSSASSPISMNLKLQSGETQHQLLGAASGSSPTLRVWKEREGLTMPRVPDAAEKKKERRFAEEVSSMVRESSMKRTLVVSSAAQRGKKNSQQHIGGVFSSLGTILLLSFLSFFALVNLLNSKRPGYNLTLVPKMAVYRSYRRLHAELSSVDLLRGGIFSNPEDTHDFARRGILLQRVKEIPLCSDLGWNHVPCYRTSNNSSSSSSTLSAVAEQGNVHGYLPSRHCPSHLGTKKHCLIPAPPRYKIPLKWPASFDGAWLDNMKFNSDLSLSGRRMARLKLRDNGIVVLDAEGSSESQQLQNRIRRALRSAIATQSELKVVLDINCALSRLPLLPQPLDKASVLCLAPYEEYGSQVQYALERGMSALVGSLDSAQLPFPSFSFDMIHCFDCDLNWTSTEEGLVLLELDRLLKPGGLALWAFESSGKSFDGQGADSATVISSVGSIVCWSAISETDGIVIWKKASNHACYASRNPKAKPRLCGELVDAENHTTTAYPPLRPCITGTVIHKGDRSQHWDKLQGSLNGFSAKELSDEASTWSVTVESYWSLLSPLIFSDHPKRQDEEEKSEPVHSVRNVMDMNAFHGSLNAAFLDARKPVWVMNVIPLSAPDTLPTIYTRGQIGLRHDWCEAFPTYPRTYDLLHGIGLLSQEMGRKNGCEMSRLFLEMDRILRPEGWVILRDKSELIEDARVAVSQMRWESRVIEVEGIGDQQLLVCQKSGRSAKAVL